MRGKVLGANGQDGAISGEDGKRYPFERDQWKSERQPNAGDEVDFEVGDRGRAENIYALRAGATVDLGNLGAQAKTLLSDGASSPLGARLLTLLRSNPAFQISLALIIASFLLTYVKIGTGAPGAQEIPPDNGVYKIVSTGDLVGYLKTSLESGAVRLDQAASMVGDGEAATAAGDFLNAIGGSDAGNVLKNAKSIASKLRSTAALSNILYIAYLVPLAAAAVIVQAARDKNISLLSVATGAASIASFALLIVCRWSFVSAVRDVTNADIAKLAAKAFGFGLGSYVILLGGVALLGVALGFVKLPAKN